MLQRLLADLQRAGGPVRLDDLGRRLGVERSALEPMLDLLVRKGVLTEWQDACGQVACSGGACGTACGGMEGCPFVMGALPRALTIRETPRDVPGKGEPAGRRT